MGCDIVFKINGDLREGLQGGSSLVTIKNSGLQSDANLIGYTDLARQIREVTLDNVAKELLKNKELQTQLAGLIANLRDSSSRAISASDIRENGIVGNFKYHTLRFRYEEVAFPELKTPFDPTILLVDKLRMNGKSVLGAVQRTTGTNGEDIYIINDSKQGVEKFARFMAVRDAILNNHEDSSELALLMPELAKAGKSFNSQKELLIDYLMDGPSYKDLLVDKGLCGLLNELIGKLRNSDRKGYTNPLDREFNVKLKKVRGTKNDYSITKKEFLQLVKAYNPELLEGLSKEQLASNDIIKEIFNKFSEGFDLLTIRLATIGENSLIFNRIVSNLESLLGFTYSSIKAQTVKTQTYKGYNIYKYTDGSRVRYLYSMDALTPKSNSRLYESELEIMDIIDNNIRTKDTFADKFNLGFRVVPSYERVNSIHNTRFRPEGSVIQVLNIDLDQNTILDPAEEALFNGTHFLSDFFRIFKEQLSEELYVKLELIIESIEDAGIFTYLINARAGRTKSQRNLQSGVVEEILSEIESAKQSGNYKYYFVESCIGSKENFFMKVIPISSDVEMSTKYQRPTPTIALMSEVIEKLNDKFHIGAEMLTQDEISERFPDLEAGTKAFIRDGQIFINGSLATSEDVIHEYTHLILGVLKALNYDMYLKLLEKIANSKEGKIAFIREKIRKAYKNLAVQDFNEEVFVAAFAEFLAGKNASAMFEPAKAELDRNLGSIFTLATEEDFNSIYKGKVHAVFQAFSRDIGKITNGLEFGRGKIFRQAANWISDLMEKGNITERC